MIKLTKFVVLFTAFALSSAASADSHGYTTGVSSSGGYYPSGFTSTLSIPGGYNPFRRQITAGVPTDTALFFHRRGARLFDKSNFEGAERAFEASLRAQGGTLREHTLLYLAHIAIKSGDMSKAKSYTRKYARASGKEIVE